MSIEERMMSALYDERQQQGSERIKKMVILCQRPVFDAILHEFRPDPYSIWKAELHPIWDRFPYWNREPDRHISVGPRFTWNSDAGTIPVVAHELARPSRVEFYLENTDIMNGPIMSFGVSEEEKAMFSLHRIAKERIEAVN